MNVTCPSPGDNVLARPSGSGGRGTICVRGTVTEKERSGITPVVRVRVTSPGTPPPPPQPFNPARDVDVPGDPQWQAAGVPVDSFSAAGVPWQVVAYLLHSASSASALSTVTVPFVAGGPNPRDCCGGSSSGSGTPALASPLAAALAGCERLEVVVADGPHAGTHAAAAAWPGVATGVWQARLGKTLLRVVLSPDGLALALEVGKDRREAACVQLAPFSATFPGDLLGSCRDVVALAP